MGHYSDGAWTGTGLDIRPDFIQFWPDRIGAGSVLFLLRPEPDHYFFDPTRIFMDKHNFYNYITTNQPHVSNLQASVNINEAYLSIHGTSVPSRAGFLAGLFHFWPDRIGAGSVLFLIRPEPDRSRTRELNNRIGAGPENLSIRSALPGRPVSMKAWMA